MRLGFLIGFLVGAGVASVLSRAQPAEAPADANVASRRLRLRGGNPVEKLKHRFRGVRQEGENLIASVKRQVREARAAAGEAATEKEAEMRLEFEAEKQQTQSDDTHSGRRAGFRER
jgi:hypothetical protein